MTDFADLKIRVDSSALVKATKDLTDFGKASMQAGRNLDTLESRTSKVLKSMGALGNAGNMGATGINALAASAAKLGTGLNNTTSTAGKTQAAISRVGTVAQQTSTKVSAFSQGMQGLSKASVLIQGPLGGAAARMVTLATVADQFSGKAALAIIAAAGLGSAFTALSFSAIKNADSFKALEARTKVMVGEFGNARGAFQALLDISSKTGASVEATADVFNRISLGAKGLGKSTQQVTQMVDLVSQLGVVSGANTQNLQAGLLQFGQAMGQGIVRAEEWNSIMENITALGNEIAKGLGKSTAEVRQMVINGKLLSKDVFAAIEKQSIAIQMQFEKMPLTFSRAANEIEVAWFRVSGEMDRTLNVTNTIAAAMHLIATSIIPISSALASIGPYLQGAAIVGSVMALVKGFQLMGPAVAAFVTSLQYASNGMKYMGAQATVTAFAVRGLQAVLMGVIPVLGFVVAALAVGEYIKYGEAVKLASKSTAQFKQEIELSNGVIDSQQYGLIANAKRYDELAKKANKTAEEQDQMKYVLDKTATAHNLTTQEVVKMIEKYGSLTVALDHAIVKMQYFDEVSKRSAREQAARTVIEGIPLRKFAAEHAPESDSIGATFLNLPSKNKLLGEINADKVMATRTLAEIEKEKEAGFDEAKRMKELQFSRYTPPAGAAPAAKPKKVKGATAIANAMEELARDEAQTKALLEARRKSEQNYINLKLKLEAENFIRDKHLNLSPKKTQGLVDRQAVVQVNKTKVTLEGESNVLKERLRLEGELPGKLKESYQAYLQEKIAIEARLKYFAKDNLFGEQKVKLIEEEIRLKTLEAQQANGPAVAAAAQEAKWNLELANALGVSTQAYIEKAQAIELEKKVRGIGLVSDEQKDIIKQSIIDEQKAKQQTFSNDINFQNQQLQKRNDIMLQGWEWDATYGERRNKQLERTNYALEVENMRRSQGVIITQAQEDAYVNLKVAQDEQAHLLDLNKQRYDSLASAVQNYGNQFATAFGSALQTGEFNFKKFTMAILADMAQIILKGTVISGLFGGKNLMGVPQQGLIMKLIQGAGLIGGAALTGGASLGASAGAIGGILGAGPGALSLTDLVLGAPKFAKGDVVTSPTMAMWGDAGPEAAMPLTRMGNGKLGVMAAGSGGGAVQQNNISITVHGSSGTSKQNQDLSEKMVSQLTKEMKGFVVGQISEQQRKGNILNPGLSV